VNAAHPMPRMRTGGALGRALALVVIFVAIGPPIGACIVWIVFLLFEPLVRHSVIVTAPTDLFELFLAILMLSYKGGGVLAALTGIAVALFRHIKGRTSLETAVVSALIANVAGILFYDVMTGAQYTFASYLIIFVPPSQVAAIVCWLIARKAGLT
jgi:hypothetical protein